MKHPWTIIALCLLIDHAAAEPSKEALEKLGAKATVAGGTITQIHVDASTFTDDNYRTIGSCTSLKKLIISGKTLTDTTLPLLAGLTELEDLSTNLTMLTDDGYQHFAPFKKLRSLALFHPSWDLKTFTGTGLAHLKQLPRLERLTFAGSTAGDAAIQAVGRISQLKEFATWHTMQTRDGNRHLLQLRNLTALRIGQRLPRGPAPAPSLDESTIPLLAQLKSLQKLELFEARLTARGLAPLKDLPELKQLNIHTTDIPAADVETLRAALKNVKIDFKPLSDADREATLVKKLKL